jgi:hypothetical protein
MNTPGTYTVTATYKGKTATVSVIVRAESAPDVVIEVTASEFLVIQGVIDGNILDDSVASIVATDEQGNTKEATITGDTFRVMSAYFTAGEVVTLQAFDAAGNAMGDPVETTI